MQEEVGSKKQSGRSSSGEEIRSESRGKVPDNNNKKKRGKTKEVLQKAGLQQTHPSAVYRKGEDEEQEHIQGAAELTKVGETVTEWTGSGLGNAAVEKEGWECKDNPGPF